MTDSSETLLKVLENERASLPDLMAAVTNLGKQPGWTQKQTIGIASNVTLNLLDVYLKKHAFLHGVDLDVHTGGYDDYAGAIEMFLPGGVKQLLLLPFFDNLMPSFESQLQHLPDDVIHEKRGEVLARLGFALEAGRPFQNIYLSRFHRYSSPPHDVREDKAGEVIRSFNEGLEALAADYANVTLVDFAASITRIGYQNAFDDRFYASAKAPYAGAALNEMAGDLARLTRGFGNRYYKVLVLDCDDTLWGGLVGEESAAGIRLDPHEYPGSVYWRVQNELLALEKAGVLLCLCSKNNPEDVDEVLETHPHMVLGNEHIILKKVNWSDKVANIREIAEELNLGLDSMVFIDDSDFECQLIKAQLPLVKTVQVPKRLPEYFRVIEGVRHLFRAPGHGHEGQSKTEQYRIRAEGTREAAKFASREDYLRSLGLKVGLSRDDESSIPRISELTLKSNQFNLTTKRYSQGDIENMMRADDHHVYAFSLEDKFGACGLTGVLIVKFDREALVVNTFLMSCRVIGRGVEFAVWERVFEDARRAGCRKVEAAYMPTAKNAQVKDFYERLGLDLLREDRDGTKHYEKELSAMSDIGNDYVQVTYAR